MRPVGLHKDLEASHCPAETTGNATDRLHRRHPNPGRVQGTGSGPCDKPGIPVGNLGFAVSKAKCQLEPTQTFEFLGFTVNSLSQELSLPNGKIKKIRAETRALLGNRQVSIRKLSQLLGKLQVATWVFPLAPLFFRKLQ